MSSSNMGPRSVGGSIVLSVLLWAVWVYQTHQCCPACMLCCTIAPQVQACLRLVCWQLSIRRVWSVSAPLLLFARSVAPSYRRSRHVCSWYVGSYQQGS